MAGFALPDRLFGASATVFKVVDCHCEGEPARVVLAGLPPLPASCDTALRKREHMMAHLDHIRKLLMLEPRGYPCQNVDYIFAPAPGPATENIQYVIAEQGKIYPLMSGRSSARTPPADP